MIMLYTKWFHLEFGARRLTLNVYYGKHNLRAVLIKN